MTQFCIQLHPERAGDVDLSVVVGRAEAFASATTLVSRFAVVPGEGFINLMLETASPSGLWALLSAELFGDNDDGTRLRRCSLVVCQGAQGWDDYRLLLHFDEAEPLDPFS